MITPKELRRKTLYLAIETQNGHIASALSIIEILIAVYGHMGPDDKFILSKGHGCLSWYALLQSLGFNPTLSGHPDIDTANGIHCTTGSLGHGLPIGVGMALARKLKGQSGNLYVLMGDGECQEGTIWESVLLARHHKLDNLIIIVDYNYLQALDKTNQILRLGDLAMFFETMGIYTSEVDGHNIHDIQFALGNVIREPKSIIAETIKGKGVSFMENDPKWHSRLPNALELKQAYRDLE